MVELTVDEFEELADQMEQEEKDNSVCTIENHDGNFSQKLSIRVMKK